MFRFTALLFFGSLCSALQAQTCSEMFDSFRKGVIFEYTSYDKKNRAQTISTHRINSVERIKDTLIAHADVTIKQAKGGKEIHNYSMPLKCHQGVLFMSMRSFVPIGQMSENPEVQLEIKGGDLTFPNKLKIGQTLPNAEMEVTMRMGKVQMMKNRYLIKDRRVEAEETITTPAGSFNCYKISYNLEYQLFGLQTMRNEMWYAPPVGTVKSVSFNGKGEVESRMELTQYIKK
ncbi:MAG: hypothetical protein NZM43_06670 [Saprospiraceae bacterium]|nr:hypothetical protein [Saprospiraceae bacterium]MDW8483994.1 hypothetical protein [Saprospiraceae bacterium]